MSWFDDMIKLGNLSVNALSSYGDYTLKKAEALDDERKTKALIDYKDKLADDNRNDALINASLLNLQKENKAELLRLESKADDLDFDFDNYIGTVPEEDRTDDMKAVFKNEADYGNYQLFRTAEHSNDVNQLKANLKATNDLNTWKIRKLTSEIDKFEK